MTIRFFGRSFDLESGQNRLRARVFISGFVQGVGFRQFIKRNASKLGLTGWVRNLPDNRVEAVFCGSKEKINEAISLCRKGPFLAEVKDVEIIWQNNQPGEESFENFEIIQ